MSFIQGMQVGSGIAKVGIDQYNLQREWTQRLQERDDAKALAADQRIYSRGRDAKADYEKTVSDKLAYLKESNDTEKDRATEAETKRHNIAVEGFWKNNNPPPGTGANSTEITPKVAAAEAAKLVASYTKKGAGPMPESVHNQYQFYLKKANPNHVIVPYQKPADGFGKIVMDYMTGGAGAAPSGGSDWQQYDR